MGCLKILKNWSIKLEFYPIFELPLSPSTECIELFHFATVIQTGPFVLILFLCFDYRQRQEKLTDSKGWDNTKVFSTLSNPIRFVINPRNPFYARPMKKYERLYTFIAAHTFIDRTEQHRHTQTIRMNFPIMMKILLYSQLSA